MKTIKKYKHFLPVVVYGIFYLKCFQYLETHITKGYHLIHTPFDDMIPFCEFFVIPYFMWFGYIAWSVLYFGFCNKNRREYYQLIINLGIPSGAGSGRSGTDRRSRGTPSFRFPG